jgi:hypothetical protein
MISAAGGFGHSLQGQANWKASGHQDQKKAA